jgi:UDP-glucose 4-epimerase
METPYMVTGGSGLAGSHIICALAERGDRVLNFDIRPPRDEQAWSLEPFKDRVDFFEGDATDLPMILRAIKEHGVKKISHQAAIFRHPFENANPYRTFMVAEMGTVNILEAARIMDLERVTMASTQVYAPGAAPDGVDETWPPAVSRVAGQYPYIVSKLASEQWGLSYFVNNGVDFVATRFQGVYGLGMRDPIGYIKDIIEKAAAGIPMTYSEKAMERVWDGFQWHKCSPAGYLRVTYGYAKNVALGSLLALDATKEQLKSRIYNIMDDKITYLSELVRIVEELSGTKCSLEPDLIELEKKTPIEEMRPLRSIERARKELGYAPKYDLRAGVEDYINRYRDYLKTRKADRKLSTCSA